MQIKDTSLICIHEHFTQYPHPTGQRNGIDIILFQRLNYQSVILCTVTVSL